MWLIRKGKSKNIARFRLDIRVRSLLGKGVFEYTCGIHNLQFWRTTIERESRSLNHIRRFAAVTDNPREVRGYARKYGKYTERRWRWQEHGSLFHQGTSDLTRVVFLSPFEDSTGSRSAQRRDRVWKTHLVGDLLRPREHLLRDHHCVFYSKTEKSPVRTLTYTRARTQVARRDHDHGGARFAALRGVERNARQGESVTSHVCVVRIPTSHPHTPRRYVLHCAQVWCGDRLAPSASLPAYVVAKVDACVEFNLREVLNFVLVL